MRLSKHSIRSLTFSPQHPSSQCSLSASHWTAPEIRSRSLSPSEHHRRSRHRKTRIVRLSGSPRSAPDGHLESELLFHSVGKFFFYCNNTFSISLSGS
ncbi:hypothetical protein TNIN_360391 [Trichonephila inaurata madagascariensis]|uniref:Uncharacterized protein n=1 Tax=Trichonephila inaurata madagascariensis TaxID=2747483 RepID=A0A8X6IA62_9ARAC|nr:hypothetical protein TNIN_360391 [Trichonephila inaurata madagascariensis]